jgi:Mg-chelatase subunit ChlD
MRIVPKRTNTSLIISLIVHAIAGIILVSVHRDSILRKERSSIPIQLNVDAPEPRLQKQKPKIKPIDINTTRRTVTRAQTARSVKINQKMDRTTAYRDIIVTDDSDMPRDLEVGEEDINMGDVPIGTGARGAGRNLKGDRSQLEEFVDKSRGKRRIVYCLDVSASMGAANKLNMARNYLKDSLLALDNERDKFNVIAFSKGTQVFHPDDLLSATKDNLSRAMDFLNQYSPQNIQQNTKTDLLGALTKALEMKPSIIAMVTDGLPTAGTTHPEKILQSIKDKNVNGDVRIFAIGMEMDMDQPEAWLLRAIAEQNKGEFQFF